MTDDERKLIKGHEDRILKLEVSTAALNEKVDSINRNVLESQARADEQGKFMVTQNNELLRQNAAFAQQLKDVFDSVIGTRDKESTRRHDLKKLKSDNSLKVATLILGSGGIGFLVFEAVTRMFFN